MQLLLVYADGGVVVSIISAGSALHGPVLLQQQAGLNVHYKEVSSVGPLLPHSLTWAEP